MIGTIGLIVFVCVVAIDVITLLYDLWRVSTGRRSITSMVHAHENWSIPLIGVQLVGAAGLAIHLLAKQ